MNVLAILREAATITIFVFSMMVFVDWLNVRSRGRMTQALRGRKWREYLLSSFLGSTPGCLGAFMNVSLYVHGLIGFGAIVGGMIATSGDEAYVMLSLSQERPSSCLPACSSRGSCSGLSPTLSQNGLKSSPAKNANYRRSTRRSWTRSDGRRCVATCTARVPCASSFSYLWEHCCWPSASGGFILRSPGCG